MKKVFAVALAAAMSLTLLAGCGGNGGGGDDKNNTAPVITGVKADATIFVGETFDALEGVTATDAEDGDLTSEIEVSCTELEVTEGKVTPQTASPAPIGYELIYNVKDSGGKEATAQYCTLYVNPAAGELENVYTSDFRDVTPGTDGADRHYWDLTEAGGAGTLSFENGALAVNVTNPGNGEDNLYLSRKIDDLGEGTYTVAFWVYASAPTKATIRTLARTKAGASPTEGWDTENLTHDKSDGYGKDIGTTVTRISHTFDLTADHISKDYTSVLLRFGVGQHTGNPGTYKVYVEKIALWKETGSNTALFTNDFSNSETEGQVYPRNDQGAESTATVADGVVKFDITKYPTTGNVWELKADVVLGDVQIKKDTEYRVSFKIKATHDQVAEVVIENGSNSDRAAFLTGSLTLKANVEQTVAYTFTAEKDIAATLAMLRFQIGKPSDGVTANTITIDDVSLVNPPKKDRVTLDKFVLFGDAAKAKLDVSNGSDDSLDNKGIGTGYFKDGKLVYVIHEGSTEQGQNKVAVGYGGNPVALPADAYYEISITVKASVALDMNVCLHDMNRAWGSLNEGVLLRDKKTIGTAEQTYTFTTADYSDIACNCELIIEFGSAALSELTANGDVTIEFSSIKIGYRELVG